MIVSFLDGLEKHSCKSVKIIVQNSKVLLFLVTHALNVHPPEIMKDDEKIHHLQGKGVERDGFLPVNVVFETAMQTSAQVCQVGGCHLQVPHPPSLYRGFRQFDAIPSSQLPHIDTDNILPT